MKKLRLAALCLGIAALSITLAVAQDEEKKSMTKGASGVLQPQMEPTGGWTSSGQLGNKSDTAWTATTTAAGVDQKPLTGKPTTVTGEIIDLSCYLQLGKHGDKHKSCGQKCIANGQPIGLLTKSGTVYMLMDEEHDPRRDGQTTFRKAANDDFAKVVEVTGTETTVRGVHAIYVQGYVNK
ncbi:MAG: hypothetical protein ACR2I2_03885 [Bryobacteraceae bacterium]